MEFVINMKHKKKSLFLVGGEDISLRIPMIKMLTEYKYEVTVVGSESRKEFEKDSIRYFRYDLDRGFTPILDLRTTYQLYRLLQSEKPDIVHTFDTKPNILASFASWLVGVPRIIRTINGMGNIFSYDSPKNALLRKVYHIVQYLTSAISHFTIFQNTDDMKYFTSNGLISINKARYIAGSGVSLEKFSESVGSSNYLSALKYDLDLEGRCTIILISRIIKSKGIIEYLESARALSSYSKEIRFLLIGNIETEQVGFDKSIIDDYSDVCNYLGYRNDVSSLIAISDIVVLPSYYKEGVPRSLIEGASLGKPLISTDVSGCRDIVINMHNGILVPIKDSNKLAEAILHLVKNPEIRKDMGEKGRELVASKFRLEKVCEGWRALY